MEEIHVMPYSDEHLESVIDICYKTGYMGEDLTGKEIFRDKKLFAYLFCIYYLVYEKENCFVAFDKKSNRVAGYIIGTLDTNRQKWMLMRKMTPRIAARLFTVTLIRYNESFKTVIHFIKNLDFKPEPDFINREYPAHFHINLHSNYQGCGIGSMLLKRFEEHVKASGVKGIHLKTTSNNLRGVPFYIKKGYEIVLEKEVELWRGGGKYHEMVFGKGLFQSEKDD